MEPDEIISGINSYGNAVVDNVSAMLAYWDKNLVCRFANSAYLDWFGWKKEDMVDKIKIDQLLGPLYEMNLPYIKCALAGRHQIFERTIPLPGGGVRYSLANYYPDIVDGEVKGFYVHVADITPLKAESDKHAAINTDSNPIRNIEKALRDSLLTEFPGVKNLAKMYFISESKLKRDFKLTYYTTIFSHYRLLQMELAERFLKSGQYNKKQVAALLHFSNPSNFYSLYNKYLKGKEKSGRV